MWGDFRHSKIKSDVYMTEFDLIQRGIIKQGIYCTVDKANSKTKTSLFNRIINFFKKDMIKIKINKLYENSILPEKKSSQAACYDVYVNSISHKRDIIEIGLGFATEIPCGWKGVIVPRSSLTKTEYVMQNSPGQIDSDYRGEWIIKMRRLKSNQEQVKINYGDKCAQSIKPFKKGDRIAQIYFEKVNDIEFVEAGELNKTERGRGGFGSTGK